MVRTLRDTALFAPCSDAELDGVVRRSGEITLAAGELLFGEADRAREVWVLLDGELVITAGVDGDEVIVDRLAPGAYLGEISLLSGAPAGHQARARGPARLLRIPGDTFLELVRSCPAVMETVLRTLAERVQRVNGLLHERERMAALGTLAAGLVHELKNPAAAANRAAGLLREQLTALEPLVRRLAEHSWTAEEVQLLTRLEQATAAPDEATRALDPLARSDREETVSGWLDEHGVDRAWELAPVLVERGVTPEQLDRLTRGCDLSIVTAALDWTERMATIRQLTDEVAQSTGRIAEIVRAVKAYSYADRTSLRTADVHEGVETSLTILGHKLRESRAAVVRAYDRALPPIQTYGTELSQVWTNLLDNAADAVAANTPAGGTVTVRTFRDGDLLGVEVRDTGPGIPPAVRARVFDPFFTTKAAGKGTGLGLEIAKRIVTKHRGTLEVTSEPGDTRFVVRLPITQG